jgi:hypothetical protein
MLQCPERVFFQDFGECPPSSGRRTCRGVLGSAAAAAAAADAAEADAAAGAEAAAAAAAVAVVAEEDDVASVPVGAIGVAVPPRCGDDPEDDEELEGPEGLSKPGAGDAAAAVAAGAVRRAVGLEAAGAAEAAAAAAAAAANAAASCSWCPASRGSGSGRLVSASGSSSPSEITQQSGNFPAT